MYKYLKDIKKFIGKNVYYDTYGGGYIWGELPNDQGVEMIGQVEDVDEKQPLVNYNDEIIKMRASSFVEKIDDTIITSIDEALCIAYKQGFKDSQQEKDNPVISVRGWGAIQHLFKTYDECKEFQDELGKFICDAVNEKLKTS